MSQPLFDFTVRQSADLKQLAERVRIVGSLAELSGGERNSLARAATQVGLHFLQHGTASTVRFNLVELRGRKWLEISVGATPNDGKPTGGEDSPSGNTGSDTGGLNQSQATASLRDLPGIEPQFIGLQRLGEIVDEFQLQGDPRSGLRATIRQSLSPRFHVPSHEERQTWVDIIRHSTFEDTLRIARAASQTAQRIANEQWHEEAFRQQLDEGITDTESRALLSLIASATDNSVVMTDGRGIVTWVNDAFVRMTGYRAESTVGQHLVELLRGPLTDDNAVRDLERAIEEGHRFKPELRFHRQDGSDFWMLFSMTPVHDETGKISRWIAVGTDVTQQVRSAELLKAARETAEQASRAKSDFLANISHEIRTPLNAIIGMTDLTLDTELTTEQRDFLTTTKSSAMSLLELVNDVLDLSKIEAGKMTIAHVDFNLADLVRDTQKALAVRAKQKGLDLITQMPFEVPHWLNGDPTRLRQVLINLLGNAIKFTEQGQVVLEVAKEWVADGRVNLHFVVKDTGIGIPNDRLEKIFEAFEQGDTTTTREFGGTGLGLTITAELLRLMGGRIWLNSEVGVGSQFHFTLEFDLIDSPVVDESLALDRLAGTRVLLVDKNQSDRRILAELLNRWGMNAIGFSSGEEAIRHILENSASDTPELDRAGFDVVLFDVSQPAVNDLNTLEQLREIDRLSQVPCLVLMSIETSTVRSRCLELGLEQCLVKPVSQSVLLKSLVELLEQKQAGGQNDESRRRLKAPARSLRVLVVDDHEANRRLAIRMLEKRGHRCVEASAGRAAVEMLTRSEWSPSESSDATRSEFSVLDGFDVVLMDVQMPQMDGLSATQQIRESEKNTERHIPIVAVTAHAMPSDRQRCLDAGMDDYLAKPLQMNELIRTVERVAETHRVPSAIADRRAPDKPKSDVAAVFEPANSPSETPTGECATRSVEPNQRSTGAAVSGAPDDAGSDATLICKDVDFQPALHRMGGEIEMLCEQMEFFRSDAPQLIASLEQAVSDRDLAKFQNAAHRLKTQFRTYDCKSAGDVAFELEQTESLDQPEELMARIRQLNVAVGELISQMQQFKSKHQASE